MEYEELKLGQLKRDIQSGVDSIARGKLIDGERVFDEIEKEHGQ